MEYLSFNKYLKEKFGQKVYKISLNAGFTCPNRDGKIDSHDVDKLVSAGLFMSEPDQIKAPVL